MSWDLDNAVTKLEVFDKRKSQIAELKSFGGQTLAAKIGGRPQELKRAERLSADSITLAFLGYSYAETGQRDAAEKVLRSLQNRSLHHMGLLP
jgi:hypothetical protein